MTNARLYYEAHVTIEPVFDVRLNALKSIAREHGFRVADLFMKKREADSETRSKHDTFMTGHGKNLEDLQHRMSLMIRSAQSAGFQVWRYKIEDAVMDSRHADELVLL